MGTLYIDRKDIHIHRFENRRISLITMIEGIIDEIFDLIRELRT